MKSTSSLIIELNKKNSIKNDWLVNTKKTFYNVAKN